MPPAHVMACKGPSLRRSRVHNGMGGSGHPLAPRAAPGWPGLRPAVQERQPWHAVPELVSTRHPQHHVPRGHNAWSPLEYREGGSARGAAARHPLRSTFVSSCCCCGALELNRLLGVTKG